MTESALPPGDCQVPAAQPPPELPADLVAAIRHARVVSFDIFDTALTRAVERPVDLFLLLAHEVGLGDAAGFAAARIAAEREARRLAWERRGAVEVTLAEIYTCLKESVRGLDLPADLMERERALELRLCRRHPVVGGAYDYARGLGKRVGFISDMYLDRALITAMLERCKYQGHDFLLVSSEVGATKAAGGLYRHALDLLGVEPAHQLHLGDNRDSDIRQAQGLGLATWEVTKGCDLLPASPLGWRLGRSRVLPLDLAATPPPGSRLEAPEALWRTLWRGLVAEQEMAPEADFWDALGYTHVGMLLLGFGLWLNQRAAAERLPRLFFLARDGHVMLAVHRLLEDRGMAHCPGTYLYASRRVLNVPALEVVDERACDFLVSGTSRLPVGAFLARVGLDPVAAAAQIRAAGFSGPDHLVLSGEEYGRLRALFRELAPVLLAQAEVERRLVEGYLEQEGVLSQSHVGLTDIGWHGSLQDSFSRLLGRFGGEAAVTGYYLGTFPAAQAREAAGARHRAWLCQGGEPAHRLGVIRASVEVFEWLFCAPHGSVVGFRHGEGGIEPAFEAGDLETPRQETAARMQAGALRFVREALACFPDGATPPPVPADLAVALLADLLLTPSAQEARLLGDLPHAEGFGDVVQVRPIARPPRRPYNPFGWGELLRGYRAAFWRTGYLRRLWPDCW